MGAFGILRDNPILTRFKRSLLRPSHVVPLLVILLVLAVFYVWSVIALHQVASGNALAFGLGVLCLIVGFGGAGAITNAVTSARANGMFDFHRISPLPPSWLTLGFFVGPVFRHYLVALVGLPVVIWLAHESPIGILGGLDYAVFLAMLGLVVQSLALLSALLSRRPKPAGKGSWVAIAIFLLMCGPFGFGSFLSLARPIMNNEYVRPSFYGLTVPYSAASLIAGVPALGFALLACTRKMRSERLCALTKPQSIACLLTLATLLLGFTWSLKRTNTITLWVLYVMVIASVILLPSATPPLGLYLKGLRRAVHEGRRRVHWWHDLAANRVAVVIFAALVGAVSTIGWELIEGRDVSGRVQYAQSIVTGVFLVVGVAFSYQYFLLTFPRRGETYFGLFMFVIWVVPFLAGILIGASTRFDLTAQVVTSLCPWVGMATSAFSPPDQSIHWPRFATLLPAIAVAFVFAILLETRLRRLDWAARSSRRPEPKLLEPVAS